MGHIKEPKGVDFIISSEPLTDNYRKEISEFISDYKRKTQVKKQIDSKKRSLAKSFHVNK